MTATFGSLLANRYVLFMGWTLFVVLWETTIVGVFLAAWRIRFDRAPSNRHYTAALVGLFGAAALALVVPFALRLWAAAEPTAAFGVTVGARATANGGVMTATAPAVGGPTLSTAWRLRVDSLAAAAALAWAAGVLVLTVRLVGGWLMTRRLTAHARRLDDPALVKMAALSAARLDVCRPFDLLESSDVEAPMVFRWRRPVMLVPRAAVLGLHSEQMCALLVHEVAHIRRADYPVNLLQSAVEVLLFFSPAVIWMSACARESREFCCDDAAMSQCGNVGAYVQALTTLAALAAIRAPHGVQRVSGPRLITRVRRLMKEEPMPRFNGLRLTALAIVLLTLIVTGRQLSAASAARIPGRADAPADPRQIPFGYAPTQEGSGVEITRVDRSETDAFNAVALRNISN